MKQNHVSFLAYTSRMPTIRIDDEVFEGLKALAEPFTDSPGSVIRRLLVEKGILKAAPAKVRRQQALDSQAQTRALTPPLTPQDAYEQFLLVTLNEDFDGRGEKRSVTRAIIEKMVRQGFIGPADLELVATGETKAENTITWGRNALKNRGLIRRGSKRGVWELSDEGREAARNVTLPKPAKR
jgi:hypothetical protein